MQVKRLKSMRNSLPLNMSAPPPHCDRVIIIAWENSFFFTFCRLTFVKFIPMMIVRILKEKEGETRRKPAFRGYFARKVMRDVICINPSINLNIIYLIILRFFPSTSSGMSKVHFFLSRISRDVRYYCLRLFTITLDYRDEVCDAVLAIPPHLASGVWIKHDAPKFAFSRLSLVSEQPASFYLAFPDPPDYLLSTRWKVIIKNRWRS